ncbi:FkbM family methyltransferase [Ideonella sp. DXS29W]|uniref:FkbM family methyltransferase n=1 Tax=Ideonella lacteola TaxID=2984193 RepID=A0ABU9BQ19_9BURK
MAARLATGDVVIDVGANVGNHCIYLAAVAGCRVEAFEPNEALCEAIRASAALAQPALPVTVHCLALGQSSSTASFEADKPDNLGAQSLAIGAGTIQVARLDDLQVAHPVRAMKIDVEGMEIDVLEGAAGLIATDRPMLYIECISDKAFRQVTRWLEARRYVCWETFNATPTHLFRPIESVDIDERLARMQAKAFHETYRTGLLLTSVRSRLTTAQEAERKARDELLKLEVTHAAVVATHHNDLRQLEVARVAAQQALVERDAARAQRGAAQAERDAAQQARDAAKAASDAARRDRDGACAERDRALAERELARQESDKAREALSQARAAEAGAKRLHLQTLAERDAGQAVLKRLAGELQQHRDRSKRLVDDQRRLKKLLKERGAVEEELRNVRGSIRFRLGSALVDAVQSPAALMRLPLALWRIGKDRRQPIQDPVGTAPVAVAAQAPVTSPILVRCKKRPTWRPDADASNLRIAALASEQTGRDFAPDCTWIPVTLDTAALSTLGADLLLIEAEQLSSLESGDPMFHRLLDQADDSGLATALWCEAGPQSDPRISEWASRVDLVLAQDLDNMEILRRSLPGIRVIPWPRGVQLRHDNPYLADQGLAPSTDEQTVQLGKLAGASAGSVDIVDAQSQSNLPLLLLRRLARGQLPVATFARALQLCFGELAISSDSPQQRQRAAEQRGASPIGHAGYAQLALRKLAQEHTISHRLEALVRAFNPKCNQLSAPRVAVIANVSSTEEAQQVLAAVRRQSLQPQGVYLLPKPPLAAPAQLTDARTHWVADVAALVDRLESVDLVSVMDPRDGYGAEYLADLTIAARFGQAQAYAKIGPAWRRIESAPARTCMMPVAVARRLLASASGPLGDLVVDGCEVASTDGFDYRLDAVAHAAPAVEPSQHGVWPGVPWHTIEQATLPSNGSDAEMLDPSPGLSFEAVQWAAWVPAVQPVGVSLQLNGDVVEFEARLDAGVVEYVYLDRQFSPAELKAGRGTLMSLVASVSGDVRTVMVFYGANGKKISHLMRAVGATGELQVPPGTAYAKLALRFQKTASGRLGRLVLADPRLPPRWHVASAGHLLVGKQYPSYDDLYRFGFVHSRVRGYRRAGTRVDVFRLTQDARGLFREFEGVAVSEGDSARLDQAIDRGGYRTVLVHYMDRTMWRELQRHLDHVRVVIWVHGAEIQPWWRRAMNHETDAQRDQARKSSDERLAMWRDVVSCDHPNLQLVFVSSKQAGEAFSDLGVAPNPCRYHVISNFIDGELFSYRPKTAELRRQILSIRPYASAVYANDLMVAAIERLSTHPVFPSLHFRVIGDGVLFEDTVAPLAAFPNVTVERRFLNQHEIARLHRDYGIFLVPSRMDTQGVSRDEAMASGLVPVTTRIAAIPEFVNERCGVLTEPEDPQALADAILSLQDDPARYLRMSEAAANAVRSRSGREQTIDRELALICGVPSEMGGQVKMPAQRVVVYGDLNLNIMDGSAIWAASLSETLASMPDVGVTLLLKARIHRTQVISRLLDLAPKVRFVEPDTEDRNAVMNVAAAVAKLSSLDDQGRFNAFVLRGFELCSAAAAQSRFAGRLWAYLTDIPQTDGALDEASWQRVAAILSACRYLLCQTPQFQQFVLRHWPEAEGKTILLPPMIPPRAASSVRPARGTVFKVGYAGKFAPRWGIRDMFAAFTTLREGLPSAELHVYGDKIHHSKEEPGFRDDIRRLLETTPGLTWHGAVDRDALLRAIPSMNACWAFRDPTFEAATHELSTKVLEYASASVPTVLARSAVNESVLGADYPLFADDVDHAARLLRRLNDDPDFAAAIAERLERVADNYSFEAVGRHLMDQGILT